MSVFAKAVYVSKYLSNTNVNIVNKYEEMKKCAFE
jgi:hypothetical protein